MSLTLQNKVAVVTGASRGIGREIAVTLAREGADVALASRDQAALRETLALVEGLGRKGLVAVTDVGDAASVEDSARKVLERFGREDVYIANVVKCRPPDNRDPEPAEIAACAPFLQKQLALLRPKVIVALGRFAAQTLLDDTTPIGRLRGQWRTYRGVKLMPTLHPAYLLRNPQAKRAVWEDIKSVLKEIGRR